MIKFPKLGRDVVKDKKDILFLRYLILGSALTIVHAISDYSFGQRLASIVDLGLFVFLITIFCIAYFGHHFLISKIIFLTFINLALFVMSSVVPRDEGIILIYFPLVTTLFTILDAKHDKISYFFAFLSLILLITLEVTDYKVFGNIRIYESSEHSFLINLISSVSVVVFSVNFLVKINKKAEDLLKENECRLTNLTREIQLQNEALAKSNTELDRFVYSASHDLRAPLMSILGLVNLAEKDSKNNTPIYLEKVKIQVKKLDEFIKDIINYSRNSRTETKKEELDIHSIVDEVINNLRFMEKAEAVNFKKSVNLKKPFKSDKSRLSVILNNLISNAIKYHDYEKPNPFVSIEINENDKEVSFSVSDNGPGIPPQYHTEIFNMFVRASENSNGSGLGLYIVKEMAEKLKGKLTLKSKEGEGSMFTLTLPK